MVIWRRVTKLHWLIIRFGENSLLRIKMKLLLENFWALLLQFWGQIHLLLSEATKLPFLFIRRRSKWLVKYYFTIFLRKLITISSRFVTRAGTFQLLLISHKESFVWMKKKFEISMSGHSKCCETSRKVVKKKCPDGYVCVRVLRLR